MKNLTESQGRLYDKLYRDLGDNILHHLQDKAINEVMLNPDGTLWVDSVEEGLIPAGALTQSQAFSIINDLAGINNFVVNQQNPRLEAEFPCFKILKGERFTAQIGVLAGNRRNFRWANLRHKMSYNYVI